jgi:hypothetical protein
LAASQQKLMWLMPVGELVVSEPLVASGLVDSGAYTASVL